MATYVSGQNFNSTSIQQVLIESVTGRVIITDAEGVNQAYGVGPLPVGEGASVNIENVNSFVEGFETALANDSVDSYLTTCISDAILEIPPQPDTNSGVVGVTPWDNV